MQTISCDILNGEKKLTVMALRIDNGPVLQKRFEEYEKLYEQVKDLMPSSFLPPPKKKLLQSEIKLNEKRRQWVLALSQTLLQDSPSNSCVRTFFAGLSDEDDSHVDLGPSEVKTLGPKDFQFLKTVGKGSFGRVFVVKHRTDGKIYAMKVLQKDHIRKKNEVKHVMAERNVLKHNIHHPFLVSLHYSFQTKEKLYFVLDFLNGGELFSHLQREKSFSETRSRFYASQIASALGYLHENNIIYRDLKPENLLLDKHGYLVLTDFGLCKEGIKAKDTTHTFCGTPEYLAPEILLKKSYDRTVDWWCLGSVLYEMLFGLPPFYSKDQTEMYDRIVNSPLKFKHHVSPGSTDLLTGLLQKDRTRRLGSRHDFTDIKNHPWFMPVDWEKLLRREVKAPFIPKIKDELDYSQFAKEFTDSNFNPASLAPQTYGAQVRDVDFGGFTYVEKHI